MVVNEIIWHAIAMKTVRRASFVQQPPKFVLGVRTIPLLAMVRMTVQVDSVVLQCLLWIQAVEHIEQLRMKSDTRWGFSMTIHSPTKTIIVLCTVQAREKGLF
jgi:hypothetical protein